MAVKQLDHTERFSGSHTKIFNFLLIGFSFHALPKGFLCGNTVYTVQMISEQFKVNPNNISATRNQKKNIFQSVS